jgi:hypothetical protein
MKMESDVINLADLTGLAPRSKGLRDSLLRRSVSTVPATITYSAHEDQLDNLRLAMGQAVVRWELYEAIVRHLHSGTSESRAAKGTNEPPYSQAKRCSPRKSPGSRALERPNETALEKGEWYEAIICVRHAGVLDGDIYRPAFEAETIATFRVLEISEGNVRITWQPVEGQPIRLGTYGARVSVPLHGKLPNQLDLEQATRLVGLTQKLKKTEEEERRTAQLNALSRAEKERQLKEILQRLSPNR